jgi:hypothetical protein
VYHHNDWKEFPLSSLISHIHHCAVLSQENLCVFSHIKASDEQNGIKLLFMLDVTDNILCFGKDGFSLEFSFTFASYAREVYEESKTLAYEENSREKMNLKILWGWRVDVDGERVSVRKIENW